MEKTEKANLKADFSKTYTKSQKFKCTECGRLHGGVYSSKICQYCWEQGKR